MKQINISQGNRNFSCCFAIVEEAHNKFNNKSYFVRGIVCANQDGYQIAFNPQFIANININNNNQKRLNFIGDCKTKGFI